MKFTSIYFSFIIYLLAVSCSSSTNSRLDPDKYAQTDVITYRNYKEGAEVTLSLKFDYKRYGEILSVRDSSLLICRKYSATEDELARRVYPITSVKFREIRKITFPGTEPDFWGGAKIGALAGVAVGVGMGLASGDEPHDSLIPLTAAQKALYLSIAFSVVGGLIGGIVGSLISTDEVIIHPTPDYDFSKLKPLARYQDEEPEYLKKIE